MQGNHMPTGAELNDLVKRAYSHAAEAVVRGDTTVERAAQAFVEAGIPAEKAASKIQKRVDELRKEQPGSAGNVFRHEPSEGLRRVVQQNEPSAPASAEQQAAHTEQHGRPVVGVRFVDGEPIEYRDLKVRQAIAEDERLQDLVLLAREGEAEGNTRLLLQVEVINRALTATGMSIETWNGAAEGERKALLDAELDDLRQHAARNTGRMAQSSLTIGGVVSGDVAAGDAVITDGQGGMAKAGGQAS